MTSPDRRMTQPAKRKRVVGFYAWLWWTRFLDVVKPKRDYAGRYPRVGTLSAGEAQRVEEILRRREERDA